MSGRIFRLSDFKLLERLPGRQPQTEQWDASGFSDPLLRTWQDGYAAGERKGNVEGWLWGLLDGIVVGTLAVSAMVWLGQAGGLLS